MGQLAEIFPRAWERWEEFGKACPDLRLSLSARSRASMVNDFGATIAEELFTGTSGVVLTDQPGFLLVTFDSKLNVRLKKYRGRGCQTSGIPTSQREFFEMQQPTLTGFPEASNCVHGYVLKRDASGLEETAIKCSTGKVLHWKIDVPMGSEGEVGGDVEHLSPPPSSGPPEPGISSAFEDEETEEGGIGG